MVKNQGILSQLLVENQIPIYHFLVKNQTLYDFSKRGDVPFSPVNPTFFSQTLAPFPINLLQL
jgi:hypothetical protein